MKEKPERRKERGTRENGGRAGGRRSWVNFGFFLWGGVISLGLCKFGKIIFPREGRLWNFGGTHKIHKRLKQKESEMQGV